MVRITIETLPHGNENSKALIGTVEVSNDKSGGTNVGNYQVRALKADGTAFHFGEVRGFPRSRLGAWELALWALRSLFGEAK